MLFYIAVYGIMNLGAFAVLSSLRVGERLAEEVSDLAGLARREPMAALAMAVCCFSLMGLPPVAGFFGKVYVFTSAFSLPAGHVHAQALIVLAVIGVLNSAIAAAYYLRIIATCYLHEPQGTVGRVDCGMLRLGMGLCAITMPALFIWPSNVAEQAQRATRGLVSEPARIGSSPSAAAMPADWIEVPAGGEAAGASQAQDPQAQDPRAQDPRAQDPRAGDVGPGRRVSGASD
jgi:NADH-quinone oxidoreductase subunit N